MDVSRAMNAVIDHVAKHSDNKYQHSMLNTEAPLRVPEFTLLTANKYLARYLASKGEKTRNPEDLKKAIHFILFELENQIPDDRQMAIPYGADNAYPAKLCDECRFTREPHEHRCYGGDCECPRCRPQSAHV